MKHSFPPFLKKIFIDINQYILNTPFTIESRGVFRGGGAKGDVPPTQGRKREKDEKKGRKEGKIGRGSGRERVYGSV